MTANTKTLILASTSTYRADLLRRLNVPFETASPQVTEEHITGELPANRAARLAKAKASALATQFPNAILIGSDQVAACEHQIFDKPGTATNALSTLMALRGKTVDFHTAVCIVVTDENASAKTKYTCLMEHTDLTQVDLRSDLTEPEIQRYIEVDQPLDCAGAFKVETLGISLFNTVRTKDPTALIGLPLIAVAKGLRESGFQIP